MPCAIPCAVPDRAFSVSIRPLQFKMCLFLVSAYKGGLSYLFCSMTNSLVSEQLTIAQRPDEDQQGCSPTYTRKITQEKAALTETGGAAVKVILPASKDSNTNGKSAHQAKLARTISGVFW